MSNLLCNVSICSQLLITAVCVNINITSVKMLLALRRAMSSTTSINRPIETAIRAALTEKLQPVFLEVINESPNHNTPRHAESHFRVLVVSDKFNDLSLIKRHRLVNNIVKERLADDFVHALSIEAKTPAQWDPKYVMEASPDCRGGYGK